MGVAVNVTDVPVQIAVAVAEMETAGVTVGLIVATQEVLGVAIQSAGLNSQSKK